MLGHRVHRVTNTSTSSVVDDVPVGMSLARLVLIPVYRDHHFGDYYQSRMSLHETDFNYFVT